MMSVPDDTVTFQKMARENDIRISEETRSLISHENRIATSASAPEALPRLLEDMGCLSSAFLNGDPDSRPKLVDTARSIIYAMQTPREAILRYCLAHSSMTACIEICSSLGVFQILGQTEEPKGVAELAEETGAEFNLLARVMKHLGAMGVVIEVSSNIYRSNGVTKTLSFTRYRDMWPCMKGCTIGSAQALPQWVKENQYRSPKDVRNCPFTMGYKTEMSFYEWLGANPHLSIQFNNYSSTYRQGRPSWMDERFYPVQERLINGSRGLENDVFLVDVGGNRGHDLLEFQSKWPIVPGRLVLQDLPSVLGGIEFPKGSIEIMPHNFFLEQPIKGARAYYLHSILHNWNDQNCLEILSRISKVMDPNYSRLLIHENVLPSIGAHWEVTAMDIMMMANVGAEERTELQWRRLIEQAGLKISKIWTTVSSAESLVECILLGEGQ